MKKDIYGAAAKGDVGFLRKAREKDVESAIAAYSDTDLLGLTSHGNNIIHVAAQHGHHDFIEKALLSFQAADRRNLICGTNFDGDTPLHIAATQRTPVIAKQLIDLYRKLSFPEDDKAPWRIRNKDGNTPLHVALLNGGWSVRVAAYLLQIDRELAAFTNNRNEAPLHLAVTYVHQGTDMLTIKMINTLNCQRGALSSTNSHFVDENEDDSISLVRSLLENHSEIGCLYDADGMTPLLRAAFSSNLPVVNVIINNCPESIEVCDSKGKNVLHYIRFPTTLEAKEFLEEQEIPVSLINKQDHDGNTPMHIAVMNHDFGTVKAMVQHNANFSLKNKEGVSVQTLLDQFATNKLDVSTDQIQSKLNAFRALVEKENEKEVIKDELMSNDLYKAVCNGEWQTLREMLNDEKQFLSRLLDGSNIIHLAIQGLRTYVFAKDFNRFEFRFRSETYPEEELIVDALKKYPSLFCQTNHLGETPLHLDLFWTTQTYKKIKEELMELKGRGELPLPPWRLKDIQGNTILHTAIIHDNYELAEYLIEIDANLAGELNHSKQTPLHLLCQQRCRCYAKQKEVVKLAKLLVEKDVSTVYSRDVEGFTPLLRAAPNFWFTDIVATEILKRHPQLIRQNGPQGRNFFHHLTYTYMSYKGEYEKKDLCEMVPQKEREILITQKDDQGNTPLDLAVEENDYFWKAQLLIECSGDLQGDRLRDWLYQHKTTTVHKICHDPIPRRFQEFLQSRDLAKCTGIKFFTRGYDVSKEDIREYMNTMGVVAALLATITFTAAFTVPGGYKGDTGIPNLGKKAAFQVFMVSDVVGMCSSMMVLFCLLWLLSKDVERDEVQFKLVDMTIKLLLLSFYATLVAFMTGVYVTTISDTLWLAIFTCVLCSLLILLMRRRHIKIISFIFTELPMNPSYWCRHLPDIIKRFH